MSSRRQLSMFFAAVACAASAQAIFDATFNNFLYDTFGISAYARGWMEFPRELPGFLTVVIAGLLCAFAVTRVGVAATLCMFLGNAGLALLGKQFYPMIAMVFVTSIGMHLLMPVNDTISLTLAHEHHRGRRMGQVGLTQTLGQILGYGLIFILFRAAHPHYSIGFWAACIFSCLAVVVFWSMHLPELHQARTPLLVRREYWLYYLLEFFAGARKQLFFTFGPWVLIKVYGAPTSSIAGLLLLAALISLGFKPLAGWLIDRFGERRVMIADGLILSVVCLGYGYALWLLGDANRARPVACACFIADTLLFALGNARAIYLSRIARSAQELTATLAMGVSVNHIVSMTIPIVAGALWLWLGYESLFLAAAVLALVIAGISMLVPPPAPARPVRRRAAEVAIAEREEVEV